MSCIRKGIALLLVLMGTLAADAETLHVDVIKIGSTQYVLVEKNGITVKIPATNEELAKDAIDNNILKKACSVLKCKDFK